MFHCLLDSAGQPSALNFVDCKQESKWRRQNHDRETHPPSVSVFRVFITVTVVITFFVVILVVVSNLQYTTTPSPAVALRPVAPLAAQGMVARWL